MSPTLGRFNWSWTACAIGYWRCTDGFRFDLASALARELHEVDRLSAFFDIIHQDPVISQVKLIAEPWDVGEGGYQVGNFRSAGRNGTEISGHHPPLLEGDSSQVAELAYRFSGSSDLYEMHGRRPHASINFVTSHDGFTLNDLVSYNQKHNEANGEENRDGTDDNRKLELRRRGTDRRPGNPGFARTAETKHARHASPVAGVPMICGGDEITERNGEQQRLLSGQRNQLV